MQQIESARVGFVVELDRFQGPLDLLLHLIREQDIDVFDIPISTITRQFLDAIVGIEEMGIDNAGEFLEMAATLVRIKAQMLLPRPVGEGGEEEDPRFELVRRLLEYEHFREVARHLDGAEADRVRHFGRGYVPPPPAPDPAALELDFGWEELWEAALRVGDRARPMEEHRVQRRAVPVEEKIALILDTLAELARVEFGRLVEPYADRLHTVVTLLAGLELAKRRDLAMRQHRPFAPLWLYKPNGAGAPPPAEAPAPADDDGPEAPPARGRAPWARGEAADAPSAPEWLEMLRARREQDDFDDLKDLDDLLDETEGDADEADR